MQNDHEVQQGLGGNAETASLIKQAVSDISARVRQKYSLIHPETVPDHVNYAKIEKYLRSVHVEITRKMFASYIKEQLLPNDHDVKNSNFTLYTHDQIIYYLLVDMFKPILPLAKIKDLFVNVLKPMIYLIGLDATYVRLCRNIVTKMNGFESAVEMAIQEDIRLLPIHAFKLQSKDDAVVQAIGSIAYYTQVESLCLAKGALDFYEVTPDNLLP